MKMKIDLGDVRNLFDPYSRRARLYPALIALVPTLCLVLAWYPDLLTENVGKTIVTLISSCGLLYGLAVFARSRGKLVEARLLREWGGWPTTEWLRHRGVHLQPPTRSRYHAYLAANVPNLRLPSAEEEAADPANADASYASAVEWLKERCRGAGFELVLKENIEYGFRRNLRGLRPIAMLLCLGGLVVAALVAAGVAEVNLVGIAPSNALDAIRRIALATPVAARWAWGVNAIAIIAWLLIVRDVWVRQAADQYARALLANCDQQQAAARRRRRGA